MQTKTENKQHRFLLAGALCCGLGAACMFYSPLAFPLYAPLFLAAFVIAVIAMAKDRLWDGLGLFLVTTIAPGVLLLMLIVVPSGEELQKRFEEWRRPIVLVSDGGQQSEPGNRDAGN